MPGINLQKIRSKLYTYYFTIEHLMLMVLFVLFISTDLLLLFPDDIYIDFQILVLTKLLIEPLYFFSTQQCCFVVYETITLFTSFSKKYEHLICAYCICSSHRSVSKIIGIHLRMQVNAPVNSKFAVSEFCLCEKFTFCLLVMISLKPVRCGFHQGLNSLSLNPTQLSIFLKLCQ